MKKAKIIKSIFIAIVVMIIATAIVLLMNTDVSVVEHQYNRILTNAGLTSPHQDTLTAYMDTSKKIDSSIANYRTYYGNGETLKVKVTFTTAISSVSNPKLIIKFGDGAERTINSCTVDDDYAIFSYNLQSGDNGGLQILNLEGTVNASNGTSITMALPGDANVYQNKIIADTMLWTISGDWSQADSKIIFQETSKSEDLYFLENNIIKNLELSKSVKLKFIKGDNEYDPKGNDPRITIVDNKIRMEYTLVDGDVGAPKFEFNACDIAGNETTKVIKMSKEISSVYTPTITDVTVSGSTGNKEIENGVDTYYLRKNKSITFNVEFNCNGLVVQETKPIIKVGGQECKGSLSEGIVSGNTISYTYTVGEDDNGIISISFPTGIAKDNVGHPSMSEMERAFNNVVADTTSPTITFRGIYLKSGSAYSSEKGIMIANDNNVNETNKVWGGTIWATKSTVLTCCYSVNDAHPMGDAMINGDMEPISEEKIYTYNMEGSDKAGNKCITAENAITIKGDFSGPTIDITSNSVGSNENSIDFVITPSDSNYNYIGDSFDGSGVTGAPKLENISVTNGTIIYSITDGNKRNIKVLPINDGNVSVYVSEGATKDNLGNLSSASLVTTCYSDKTAPVITSITGVPTEWCREATISVIAHDAGIGLAEKAYSITKENSAFEGEYQASNCFTINDNGIYIIKVKDSIGNEIATKIAIEKIDNTQPTIDGVEYPTEWTNQNVTVTVNAMDRHSGVALYSFDGGNSWQPSPSKEYSSNTTIEAEQIQVKDNVGLVETYKTPIVIANIDKIAPTIGNVKVESAEDHSYVTLTIENAVDQGGSGLAENCYSFDGQTYTNSASQRITKNGDVTISVRDNAGNVTTITKTITDIVGFNPVVTITNIENPYVISSNGSSKIRPLIKVEETPNVYLSYVITNSNEQPTTGFTEPKKSNTDEPEITILNQGTYYLWVKVSNENKTSDVYKCSNEIIVKNSTITLTPNTTDWTNQDVTVDVNYDEGLTENKKIYIGNNVQREVNAITVSENATVHAEATDKAGNKVTTELVINNIDKVAPKVTIGAMDAEYVISNNKADMINMIKLEEEHIKSVEYTWTREKQEPTIWDNSLSDDQLISNTVTITKEATISDKGTWYLYVKAIDMAGNETIVNTNELNVKVVLSFDTTSENTTIDEIKQENDVYYLLVQPGTTAESLFNNLISSYDLAVKRGETTIDPSAKLATNDTINILYDQYNIKCIIAVKGDITGDGEVTLIDVIKLNGYRNQKVELTKAELLAGDVEGTEDAIDLSDILKINSYRNQKIEKL